MMIEAYGKSDVGMRREKNEDSYLINKELGLFMVADGMGGHAGGEFASNMAVRSVEEMIQKIEANGGSLEIEGEHVGKTDYRAHIKHSIQEASNRIFVESIKNPSLRGMGTTSVAMLVRGGRIYVANVGDSRCYLIRDGNIVQLTTDHSIVGEQLRAGMITQDAAREHKLKNIITRSVGFQEKVEIDVVIKVPKPGDVYLMCSDGLSNMVDDEQMLEIVTNNTVPEACEVLVDSANARGGDDNITVVLAKVTQVGPEDEGDEADEASSDESTIGI